MRPEVAVDDVDAPAVEPCRASVVICTRNRAALAAHAVASVARQDLGHDQFEVLVVDNASTDATAALAVEWVRDSPNVRYVREEQVGLSAARNRGLEEARGEVVAFLDDDAVAAPGWLAAVVAAFDADPDLGAVGGPVLLVWPGSRPRWLSSRLDCYYAAFDRGEAHGFLRFPEYPCGANMAVRATAAAAVGPFVTSLGRRGASLASGEETEFFLRLDGAGFSVRYVPGAVVHHRVGPERVARRWLLRRACAQGRSDAVLASLAGSRPLPVRVGKAAFMLVAGGKRSFGSDLVRQGLQCALLAETARASYYATYILADIVTGPRLDRLSRRQLGRAG